MADSEAMCTVVVSLAPQAPVPLLLLGIRDEFTGRPWQPPARHWAARPLPSGAADRRARRAGRRHLARGAPRRLPRVSCILNGRGQAARPDRRRSRGDLPLRAAAEGQQALKELHQAPDALARYDPFYLVCADLDSVLLLSWDGSPAILTDLGPGTHMLTNAGHMYPAGRDNIEKPADEKAVRYGPRFAAVRPAGDPDATIKDAWTDWLALTDGDDQGRSRRDHRPARATRRPGVRHYVGQPGRPGHGRPPALRLPPVPARPHDLVLGGTRLEELEVLAHLPVADVLAVRDGPFGQRGLVPPDLVPLHHDQVGDQRVAERLPVERVRVERVDRLGQRGGQRRCRQRVRVGVGRGRRFHAALDAVQAGRDVRGQVEVGFAAGSPIRISTWLLMSPGEPWTRTSAPRFSTAQQIRSGAKEYGRKRL